MENESRDYMNRSEKRQRYQNSGKRKKMDRLLNILIAIVSILIILNLISIFTDKDQNTKQDEVVNATDKPAKDAKMTEDTTEASLGEETTSDDETIDEPTGNDENETSQLIVAPSEDPIVDEVIVNPNWKSTPTKQTGEHVSAYTEGHIDYEEKLETFQNAVSLEKENIIVWSVKNNGGPNSSVAVLSSKDADRTEKYRVYIEWIENEGWMPVKVEKLHQLDGAY